MDSELLFIKLQKQEIGVVILLFISILAIGLVMISGSLNLLPFGGSGVNGSVSVEGTLLHKGTTAKGGNIIMIVKIQKDPVQIFVPASSGCYDVACAVKPGYVISITGKEQGYKDRKEIVATTMTIRRS